MPRPLQTVCLICGKDKIIDTMFVNGVERKRSRCSKCHSAKSYASRVKKKTEHAGKVKERLEKSVERRAYELWKRAKDRAGKKHIEFELARENVIQWLQKGRCSATNLPLDMRFTTDKLNPLAPSLDRISPLLGYTISNTRIVCWIFNRAKGDGSDDDVYMLSEALNAVKISSPA